MDGWMEGLEDSGVKGGYEDGQREKKGKAGRKKGEWVDVKTAKTTGGEGVDGWRDSGMEEGDMEWWRGEGAWLLSCIDLLQSGMAGRVMKCGI